jgi:hypothetical protein
MIRSFRSFYFKSPQDLSHSARLKRVMRASEATPPLVTAFFAITGILTFVSGYFVLRAAWDLKSWGVAVTGLLMIPPLGFSLLWAAKLFLLEHQINPLRGYFKNPHNYDFADGEVFEASYQEASKKNQARVFVRGRAKIKGSSVSFFFNASPAAWVELQDRLPFKAKVLYEIAVPAHCSLVGIELPPQPQ